jgi:hypothetical protein
MDKSLIGFIIISLLILKRIYENNQILSIIELFTTELKKINEEYKKKQTTDIMLDLDKIKDDIKKINTEIFDMKRKLKDDIKNNNNEIIDIKYKLRDDIKYINDNLLIIKQKIYHY